MAMSSQQAARLRQGRRLFHQGKYNEAAEVFSGCLDAEPENVAALAGLGLACSRIGQHERALGLISQAANLRPRSPAVHFARGLVCHSAGDSAEARTEFDRVLDLQSDHELARRWRQGISLRKPVETPPIENTEAVDDQMATSAGKGEPVEVDAEEPLQADEAEVSESPADERWPDFETPPLKKGDAWGGLKVSRCEKDLLAVTGARSIVFQKKDPNVVEKTFLGLFSKKMSARNWTALRITFTKANRKTPEKALLEFLDGEGKARLTLPGGKTADGKALFGIRAAVHLARLFNLDIQVEGEPEEGGNELVEAISQLG